MKLITGKALAAIALAAGVLLAMPAWAGWKSFNLNNPPSVSPSLPSHVEDVAGHAPAFGGDPEFPGNGEIGFDLGIEDHANPPPFGGDELPQPPSWPESQLVAAPLENNGPQIAEIPEPGSVGLLALGLGVLVWRSRRVNSARGG